MAGNVDALSAKFFEAAATPFALLDREGAVLHMNSAWKSVLATPAAALGKPISDLLETADAERIASTLEGLTEEAPKTFLAKLASAATGASARSMQFHLTLDTTSGTILVTTIEASETESPARESLALQVFSHVTKNAALILWSMDSEGTCTMAEGKGLELLGVADGAGVGGNFFDVYKDNPELLGSIVRALGGEEVRYQSTHGDVHFDGWLLPIIREADGSIDGVVGLSIDASVRVKNERELRDKLELIERQSATIRALATPIIQIWDEVLCLPVIGTVDSARTADMMQGLLETIVREQARYAIVDLTGVEVVDTSTADHLIRLFRAARVLGVEGILCGIRPAVAQTIVALGLDLASVRTMRSLRDALVWCIRTKAAARVQRNNEPRPTNANEVEASTPRSLTAAARR